MNTIQDWLHKLHDSKGSDLFVTVGAPPCIKVHGKIKPLTREALTHEMVVDIIDSMMTTQQREEFHSTHECQFAVSLEGVARFRVSAFYQRNMSASGHIITIEDPIEFVHKHRKSLVTQREVGIDTESFEVALKNTLRQAPDVILIGEIRTREAMEHAITFAETGHLCLTTLHANNANQAMDRILHFFPEDRHPQILLDLSFNLKGVVAQQLIPSVDGSRRHVALEIMLNSPLVQEKIRKGKIEELKELMKDSRHHGMVTFDQSLLELYQDGLISYEEALRHADWANDLRLAVKLSEGGDADSLSGKLQDMNLVDDDR
jgi:twitching motility protein PilU